MGYVITGIICVVVGAIGGALAMGLCVAMHNNSEYVIEDDENGKEGEWL